MAFINEGYYEVYRKMYIAIVDDNVAEVDLLKRHIEKYIAKTNRDIRPVCYYSPALFLAEYRSQFDLVILDIQMPEIDGLKVAEKIRRSDKSTMLVFITGMSQYAIAGYKVQAMDYILKPVAYYDFSYMLDNVFKRSENQKQVSIVINNKLGSSRIQVSDILYIEVQNHKLFIHTRDGVVETWGALTTIETELPKLMFSRINSGVTVNLNAVIGVDNDSVVLPNEVLPLSRRKKKEFCSNLARYFGGKTHD